MAARTHPTAWIVLTPFGLGLNLAAFHQATEDIKDSGAGSRRAYEVVLPMPIAELI